MNKFDAQIVRVAIDSVIPYANNTKKHPAEQIDKLASMIAMIELKQPFLNSTNLHEMAFI